MKAARKAGLERQLRWWLTETSVTIHLLLSNWTKQDEESCGALAEITDAGGTVSRVGPQLQILNRIECLRALYDSQHDWGIMLDDDAVLYNEPHHNSGPALFAEMAANGTAAYDGVDVFFPINPQKVGFSPIWKKDPDLFRDNHVFRRNLDLKGSMFVVRNFVKEGRSPVYPPSNFVLHGEDTLFAIEAVANGRTVMQCQNIVLKEFSLPSHYAAKGEDRKPKMREGNEWIASRYGNLGLRMKQNSHLLDKSDLLARCYPPLASLIFCCKPLSVET
ncbi:hypothetical protein [Aurantimonas coralicida]|uniref:hypothetical protein n=1 Tax=Aurantimonas coralicida TaxID=182270 RepID=UPI001D189FE8|nr:hypothetical protein [Aurantimonas coralicida]MCC4300207.1 hypothetical protein [Aurantimonas coralicida]